MGSGVGLPPVFLKLCLPGPSCASLAVPSTPLTETRMPDGHFPRPGGHFPPPSSARVPQRGAPLS